MHPIYDRLSRIGFLSRSYSFKFLFIAFLGIHVPLIGLIIFILCATGVVSTATILVVTLVLTLGATSATLFVLNGLLTPLRESQQSLQSYLSDHALPALPTHYTDEAGKLMQHIQVTITELNSLLEEKKDLTALLSHDLRTPLHSVKTYANILQEQELTKEEVKELAEAITESAVEQQAILENVLEILRMDYLFQQGNHVQPVKLEALIEDILQAMMPMAHAKEIQLTAEFSYSGTAEVQPELFKQVLKNLVSNAIKFSQVGERVQLRVYEAGGQVFVEVIDAGIGFAPEVAEQLFDRFTSLGRKGTAGEPTTGLGLYLSRKIIRHQRGELKAFSEGEGKGAIFRISLN